MIWIATGCLLFAVIFYGTPITIWTVNRWELLITGKLEDI